MSRYIKCSKKYLGGFKTSFHRLKEENGGFSPGKDSSVVRDNSYIEEDPNATKIVSFIFALYEMKAKEEKNITEKIHGILKRTFKESSAEKAIRRAGKVQKAVSISCCPPYVLPLTSEEIYNFRFVLEKLVNDLTGLIGSMDYERNSLAVAKVTHAFIRRWNSRISSVDNMFLPGYGLISDGSLKIDRASTFTCVLHKIQKCEKVPREIKSFKCELLGQVLSSSDRFFQTLREDQRAGRRHTLYSC